MAVYAAWMEWSGYWKVGYAEDDRVFDRCLEHTTSGGPCHPIYVWSGATRADEKRVHAELAKFRVSRPGRKPSELFRGAEEFLRFFRTTGRRLGFARVGRVRARRDTWTSWLCECALAGCERSAFALAEQARFRSIVPQSARGGWPLVEMLSGSVTPQMFLPIDGLVTHGVHVSEVNGWLMHRVSYGDATACFPVFAEAYHYRRIACSVGAYDTGIRFKGKWRGWSDKRRKSASAKPPRVCGFAITCAGQTSLFDVDSEA